MISEDDIIPLYLTDRSARLCMRFSRNANICGISYVPVKGHEMESEEKRRDEGYTTRNLEYQFIGQVTTCAASEWLFRDGTKSYSEVREEQDKNPYAGDGGTDLKPYPVDVKGSRMRASGRKPMQYNFPLRPVERHKATVQTGSTGASLFQS